MRLACCLVLVTACDHPAPPPPQPVDHPAQYAVPFIGSGGFGYHNGSAFPGATAPHGLVKVGPDTRGPYGTIDFLHYSGYWYGDDQVQGFSHMHLHGTGATDYGVLALMPVDSFDDSQRNRDGYGSLFRKASETAAPGSYAVTLDRFGIHAELTATVHAAHHRYTFTGSGPHYVVLDLDHHLGGGTITTAAVQLSPMDGRISGMLHSVGGMSGGFGGYEVFFAARTRQVWTDSQVWTAKTPTQPGQVASGQGVGVALRFDSTTGQPAGSPAQSIEVQVGLSLVSEAAAAANLAAEMPAWEFDKEAQAASASWEALLGALRVWGGGDDDRRKFYSALYRSFLMPSIHSDADGGYRGHDGVVRSAQGFHFVSDMSLWDSYRTVHPLYSLIAPSDAADAARSLIEMAHQTGALPKWPLAGGDSGSMIGASAEIVLADSYLRGVSGFDASAAYTIARAAALAPVAPAGGRGGRDNADSYMKLGYVPADVRSSGSVSLTTELARDDFALGQLALALGQKDDSAQLLSRAQGYRKLFDAQTGFLRARNQDGGLADNPFNPTCICKPYVEANAWQSLWMPSYDLSGLTGLLGGQAGFVTKLEALFEQAKADYEASDPTALLVNAQPRPYYWAGNEPDMHAPFLFAQAGRPDLTQRWARWIMSTQYGTGGDGLPGNDDGGTMSAWYVFAALGLYPDLGTDGYIVGAPLFPRIEVRLPGGVFTIEAPEVSDRNQYVQELTLDGRPVPGFRLRQADLRAGSVLRFVMGSDPRPAM